MKSKQTKNGQTRKTQDKTTEGDNEHKQNKNET